MSNQKSYIYWAARGARPVMIAVLGRLRRKTYSRGREDKRSGTEKRYSHKWFRTIFPCKNIFYFPPQETQKALRIKKAICVDRSDSIMALTIERSHLLKE